MLNAQQMEILLTDTTCQPSISKPGKPNSANSCMIADEAIFSLRMMPRDAF